VRIVQVANRLHPTSGSAEVVAGELARRYVSAGHHVMSIRPGRTHHLARLAPRHVEVVLPGVAIPATAGDRLFVRRGPVAALIGSWRPDVVEVHDTTTLGWAGALATQLGATGTLFVHDRPVARRRHRGFDVVVAPSRYAARGLPAACVVPFGVDLDTFHPDRRHLVRRDPAPARVLLVGRLTRRHRPLLAAQAVAELRWRGWDVELLAVGDGPQHTELVAADVGGGARLLGYVADRDHLAALLADADVVLCTAARSTFGLPALEALASGTPVVTVDDSAVPALLVPGAGTARPADAGALADGLAAVLRGDREAQRHVARRRAEHFTWDRTVEALLTTYASALAPRPSVA
jgi:alpha-1,6-mannosyltransferase